MKVFVFVLFFPAVLCCSVLITIIRNVRNLKWRLWRNENRVSRIKIWKKILWKVNFPFYLYLNKVKEQKNAFCSLLYSTFHAFKSTTTRKKKKNERKMKNHGEKKTKLWKFIVVIFLLFSFYRCGYSLHSMINYSFTHMLLPGKDNIRAGKCLAIGWNSKNNTKRTWRAFGCAGAPEE